MPVLGDVDAAAKPDLFDAAHVLKQSDQASAPSRPADEAVMQSNRQKLGRAFLTLTIEQVERVTHVFEKILSGREAAVLVEAVVVCFVRIRDDEMGLVLDLQPVR